MKLCNSGKKYQFYVLSTVLFVLFGFSSFSNPVIDKSLLPPPVISPAGPVTFCGSGVLTVTGFANNSNFQWQNGSGNISNATSSTLTVTTSGTYTCIVTNGGNSTTLTAVVVTINANPSVIVTATDNSICNGQSTILTATGATNYSWSPSTGLSTTNSNPVTANPTSTTTYTVTGTDANGCSDNASITITVKPKPTASFTTNLLSSNGCPRKKKE